MIISVVVINWYAPGDSSSWEAIVCHEEREAWRQTIDLLQEKTDYTFVTHDIKSWSALQRALDDHNTYIVIEHFRRKLS